MSKAFLEKVKKALLDKSHTLELHGVTLLVPPVPMGAMAKLCDISKAWDAIDLEDEKEADAATFVAKISPIIDELAEVLLVTVAQCDDAVDLDGLKLLINFTNFHEVLAVLMMAAGLMRKPSSPTLNVGEVPVKKPKSRGQTGTK